MNHCVEGDGTTQTFSALPNEQRSYRGCYLASPMIFGWHRLAGNTQTWQQPFYIFLPMIKLLADAKKKTIWSANSNRSIGQQQLKMRNCLPNGLYTATLCQWERESWTRFICTLNVSPNTFSHSQIFNSTREWNVRTVGCCKGYQHYNTNRLRWKDLSALF